MMFAKPFTALLVVALFLATFSTAQAAPVPANPLNLTKKTPDIFSSFITIDFNAGSGAFTASGLAEFLDLEFGTTLDDEPIDNGATANYNLSATIDAFGNASAGSLSITGTIASLGFNSGTLLSGDLLHFGFEAGSPANEPDTFEFVFSLTGGDLKPLYGANVGVIMTDTTPFDNDFGVDFDNKDGGSFGQAVADNFVPLPATFVLAAPALLALIGRRPGCDR